MTWWTPRKPTVAQRTPDAEMENREADESSVSKEHSDDDANDDEDDEYVLHGVPLHLVIFACLYSCVLAKNAFGIKYTMIVPTALLIYRICSLAS